MIDESYLGKKSHDKKKLKFEKVDWTFLIKLLDKVFGSGG